MAARKMIRRKKPRTPAQKAAIKKLIALNKKRAKATRKPARKKRPLTPAQKRAVKKRKTARRKSHSYVIRVTVSKPKKHSRWFTGKGFVKASDRVNHPPKRYVSQASAKKDVEKMFTRLPTSIRNIEIVTL